MGSTPLRPYDVEQYIEEAFERGRRTVSLEERGVNPYKGFTVVFRGTPVHVRRIELHARKRQKKHYKLWKIPMNCGIIFGNLPVIVKFFILFSIIFPFSFNFVTALIFFCILYSIYFSGIDSEFGEINIKGQQ